MRCATVLVVCLFACVILMVHITFKFAPETTEAMTQQIEIYKPTRPWRPFERECHKVRASCPTTEHPPSTRNIVERKGKRYATSDSLHQGNCIRQCLTLWDCQWIHEKVVLHSNKPAQLQDLCGNAIQVGDMSVYNTAKARQFPKSCDTAMAQTVNMDLFTRR